MSYTREEYEAVIRELVDRIKDMQPEEKKESVNLLVLMCGGKTGAELVPQQLECIRKDGCQMKLVFTETGNQMFGEEWVSRNRLSIPIAGEKENFLDLLMEADAVIIPVLTVNTASKIVHGIADDRVSTIIMQALLQNKPVIAAQNACDPASFAGFSQKKNLVYYNMLKSNLEKLEQFGVRMINSSQIYYTVKTMFSVKNISAEPDAVSVSSPLKESAAADSMGVFSGRVLSAGDIRQSNSDTIRITGRVIVTPAAMEAAEERNITIIKM